MKINIIKSVLLIAVISGMFTSCVREHFDAPVIECTNPSLTTTKTVQDIVNQATTSPVLYAQDDVIEAYVTSSDEKGNFYKSISFQSITTGTQVPVGFSVSVNAVSTFAKGFIPGKKVYIKLKGLYTAMVYNSLQIGTFYQSSPTATPSIGRISENEYSNFIIAFCDAVSEDSITRTLSIANAINNANLNTLIELDGVQFVDASLNRTYYDVDSGGGATNHYISPVLGGASTIIRFSSYAPFSHNMVPSGSGKIRGVLTKYGSDFQFMVRYESDIRLTNPRVLPLYEESFTSNFNNWVKYSVTGAQVWTLNTANGNPGSCADMNGYSGGAVQNEDWLISPAINLSSISTASLSFDTAKSFTGNAIQVYVSTNYSGSGAPSAASWTLVTGTLATASNFVWTNSGNISLTPYLGNSNVRVAFKYTSTTSAAAQWRVDNVKVIGN
jgi:hypothetical protein